VRPPRPAAHGHDPRQVDPGEQQPWPTDDDTRAVEQPWRSPHTTGPIEIGPDGRILVAGVLLPGAAPHRSAPIVAPDTVALSGPPIATRRRPPWGDEESLAAATSTGTSAGGPAQDAPSPAPPDQGSRLVRLARRASWNLTDQVITAATNTALFVVLARTVSTHRLDAFTNAFYVFTLMIGIGRAMVGQVLNVRFSGASGRPLRTAIGQAFGFVLVVTTAVSVIVAAVGAVALTTDGGRTLGAALLALAVVLPALIMQDACRMAFFARSNARQAALNDGLWAVLQFGGIAALIRFGHAEVGYLVLAWGGGAAVCVLLALSQLRVVPSIRGTGDWLRRSWDLSRFFLAENLLTSGAFTGGFLLVGALVGEGAVSAIRGAQVLVGPLETLSSAMFTFALPELARRTWLEVRTRWKIAVVASATMLTVALLYTVALWLVPDGVGRLVFRDNWDGPRQVLLPIALGSAAARACLGPAVTIYAMGLARRTFRLMIVEAPLVLSLMIGGALAYGVVGAAWGLAANQALLVPLWFLTLRSVLRLPREQREAEAFGGADPHDAAARYDSDQPDAVPADRGPPYRPRHATTGTPLPGGSATDRPRARHSAR